MSEKLEKPVGKVDLLDALTMRYRHNQTLQTIAAKYGVSEQAVSDRIKRFMRHLPNAEEIEAYRKNKSILLDGVEMTYIRYALEPDKLKEASANNIAYSYQQYATQNRLERGLATEIVDTFQLTDSVNNYRKKRLEILKEVMVKVLDNGQDIQDVVPLPNNNDVNQPDKVPT